MYSVTETPNVPEHRPSVLYKFYRIRRCNDMPLGFAPCKGIRDQSNVYTSTSTEDEVLTLFHNNAKENA